MVHEELAGGVPHVRLLVSQRVRGHLPTPEHEDGHDVDKNDDDDVDNNDDDGDDDDESDTCLR